MNRAPYPSGPRVGSALLVAVAGVALAVMARGPSTLPSREAALLFLLPAVILLAMDWRGSGFVDVDFALGADVALLVASPGVYGVFFVVLRRVFSALVRSEDRRAHGLRTAVYVLFPPVVVGLMWALGAVAWRSWGQPGGTILATAFLALIYVSLDAVFGLLQRTEHAYWPWALEANTAAYGLLWLSMVSLAVFGEMTLSSLGLLSVALFTVLAVLLRVASGFARRVLNLYKATAEALTAALEATAPGAALADAALAATASRAALELGLPERDRELVQSAAWLKTILWQGPQAHGARQLVGKEDLALSESLRIADASEAPAQEPSARFRRLGFLLVSAQMSLPPVGSDVQRESAISPDIDEYRVSPSEAVAVRRAFDRETHFAQTRRGR